MSKMIFDKLWQYYPFQPVSFYNLISLFIPLMNSKWIEKMWTIRFVFILFLHFLSLFQCLSDVICHDFKALFFKFQMNELCMQLCITVDFIFIFLIKKREKLVIIHCSFSSFINFDRLDFNHLIFRFILLEACVQRWTHSWNVSFIQFTSILSCNGIVCWC